MKKIVLSIWVVIAMSNLGLAGGDMKDVEPAMVPVIPIVEEDTSDLYVGLGLIYNRIFPTTGSWFNVLPLTQDQTGGLTGILGYDFNEYITVEGRINKTFFELDYADMIAYSIFLKPQYPVTEEFKVYGLLGFGLVQVDANDGKVPAHADKIGENILDDTSFQWGFGASYLLTENWSVFADYTSLAKDNDIDLTTLSSLDDTEYDKLNVDGLTIGVLYKF